jgi:hypothetical protein
MTNAGPTPEQVRAEIERLEAVEPSLSVLSDTGGPGFAWLALAGGVLLVIGGLLLKRIIH